MADKWPLANGNYSTAANWNGGTLPVDGDDIYLDNRTITLDQTVNLPNARLLTTQRSGGTAGGVLNVVGTNNLTLLAVIVGVNTPISVASGCAANITIPTLTPSTTASVQAITVNGSTGINITFTNCLFLGGDTTTSRNSLFVTGASGNINFVNCTARGGGAGGAAGVSIGGAGLLTVSGTLNVLANASTAVTSLSITAANISGTLAGNWEMWNGATLIVVNAGGAGLTFNVGTITWGTVTNATIALITQSSSAMEVTVNAPELTMHTNNVGPLAGYLNGTGILRWNGTIRMKRCYVLQTIAAGVIYHTGELIYDETGDFNAGVAGNIVIDTVRAANGMLPTMVNSLSGNGIRFRSTSQIIGLDDLGNTVILSAPAALADLPVPSDVRAGVVYNDGTQTGTYVPGNEIAESVWTYATRTITAGGLDAAGVRAAVGLAAANLDTQLGGLASATSNIQSQVANLQFDGDGYLYVDVVAINGSPSLAGRLDLFLTSGINVSGLVNVGSIAADAIGASQLAASAITEIQSGIGGLDAAGVRAAIGLAAANLDSQLSSIASKTTLLGTGQVTVIAMVSPTGEISSPIIIGDDFLEANGRAFEWTVPAVPGVVVGTAEFYFGGKPITGGSGWFVQGEVSDVGGGNWKVSAELPRTATSSLSEGQYRWSGEIRDASGNEVTRIRSDSNRHVQLVAKQT